VSAREADVATYRIEPARDPADGDSGASLDLPLGGSDASVDDVLAAAAVPSPEQPPPAAF
jgi:hypothetical protein